MLIVTLIDVAEAAYWLGTTVGHVRVLAHRDGWRRVRVRRQMLYVLEDVTATRERRALRE